MDFKGEQMFTGKLVTVSSKFDTGDFTGNFAVHAVSDSYDTYDTSIQKKYNLSYAEFDVLEVLVCKAVEEFLNAKEMK